MEEIGIDSTLVEEIRKGNKYIEGVLGTSQFLKLQEGDTVSVRSDLWQNGKIIDSSPYAIGIKITQILYFESFSEMMNAVDHKGAVPSAKTAEEAVKVYGQFYNAEDEKEFGVVALFFEPIL